MTLDYDLFKKSLYEIKGAGLSLRYLALVGFGEPLFNSRTPDMARLGRELFPDANIYVDTNANFGKRRAQELADCGLNLIRLALDGSAQANMRRPNSAHGENWPRTLRQIGPSTRVQTGAVLRPTARHAPRDLGRSPQAALPHVWNA